MSLRRQNAFLMEDSFSILDPSSIPIATNRKPNVVKVIAIAILFYGLFHIYDCSTIETLNENQVSQIIDSNSKTIEITIPRINLKCLGKRFSSPSAFLISFHQTLFVLLIAYASYKLSVKNRWYCAVLCSTYLVVKFLLAFSYPME